MHEAYLRHRTPPKASKKHVGAHWRTVANFGGVVMLNCYAISLCAAPARKAEGVRFELTRPFGLPVFKTGAINRSATPPGSFVRLKTHYSITPLLQVKSRRIEMEYWSDGVMRKFTRHCDMFM